METLTITTGALLISATNVAVFLTALVSLWSAYRVGQRAAKAAERNEVAIAQVHVLINSRMDELLKAQEKIAFAAGAASERKDK
jgi:hypothetical protein